MQQHKSRNDNATWGFVQQALPIATTASVLDRGYNPLTPFALYRHHPVFDGFHVSQAPFDADNLVDFVGTKNAVQIRLRRLGPVPPLPSQQAHTM